jgi:hypothetical protein
MSIKTDLRNQVRQTNLPKWKPLIPLFEAVMNGFQAIKDAKRQATGSITIDVLREKTLLPVENPAVTGFRIADDGIGLTDSNFDSFNTAFSPLKIRIGGKGLGRFTWLKAFERAEITSIFADDRTGELLRRKFVFDEDYDLDERGLPSPTTVEKIGTIVQLQDYREIYKAECPRTTEVIVEKLIEHFLLVLLEPGCSRVIVRDGGRTFDINDIFERDYKANASTHTFAVNDIQFTLHGFRLPTSRSTKHKLVYAADQRAVISDNLEDYLPNLSSRLIDENGDSFFYLAVVQSPYLNEHVTPGRTDFDFSPVEDADLETQDLFAQTTIRRSDIRNNSLPLIQADLSTIIETINVAKLQRIRNYVQTDAPQYRILLKYSGEFIDKLPPQPSRVDMETTLHRELYQREVKMKQESSRIIREAEKVDNYEDYSRRFVSFLEQYNELGASALAQYVAHRKIILEFLARAISIPEGEHKYPLERVVHQLVFPMRHSSEDTPYTQQNLWMIDERLTFHSFISSDNPLNKYSMLEAASEKRGDIVIFDEKIIFSDVRADEHPINSITTIEFKRPGRDDYDEKENPIRQAFRLINDIRSGTFKLNGRRVSVANEKIPATAYCVCDITPTLRTALGDFDAQSTPDNQGYYGFNKTHNVYFEVIDYNKMLRDATMRNRIFFDKLNLASDHG